MATITPTTYAATLLPLYQAFTEWTPVIPKMYWDVYSQEERIKAICREIGKLVAYANKLGIQINTNTEEIEELAKQFDEFKAGAFDDYYEQVISTWVQNHMPEIIRQAVKMVFFGLTSDGYFCAYIPDAWSDIVFDTGAVYGRSDYGRLILKMETDGDGVIDNTYAYSLNDGTDTVEQLIKDLESTTRRTDMVFDTLYTNLDEEVTQNGTVD